MRLLVVDDDRALRDVLRRALSLAGYEVKLTETGAGALSEVNSSLPDAVVLDIGLPDIDGLEVCRLLRREGNRVPVLMLTARDAVSDRIDGLDAGADDYLVKPFDIDELKARLRALLRRAGGETTVDGALSFVDLRLDSARHGVMVGETFVELTRTEYQLLELLMLNPRRVLPHTLIYDRVWGYDFGPTSNALRVYVGYLRRKLEDAGAQAQIHTVRGVGYSLREPAGMSLRARMALFAGAAVAIAVIAVVVAGYRGHPERAPGPGRPVAAEPGQAAAPEHRARAGRRPAAGRRVPGRTPRPERERRPRPRRGARLRPPAAAGVRRSVGHVHAVQAGRRHVRAEGPELRDPVDAGDPRARRQRPRPVLHRHARPRHPHPRAGRRGSGTRARSRSRCR